MTEFHKGQQFFCSAFVPRSQQQIGKPQPPPKRKNRDTKPKRRKRGKH